MPTARALRALILAAPAAARASLDLSIVESTASPGGTGSFDVLIASSGGTYAVSGFSIELRVAGASGVVFTGVGTNTAAAPYLFGTLQTPPFSFTTFPATDFIASDSSATAPGTVTLRAGDVFGLARITYSVAPGAALGPVTVSFAGTTGAARTTEVTDISGTPFAGLTTTDGTIRVASAVPEPASAVLVALGMAGLFGLARRPCWARPPVA